MKRINSHDKRELRKNLCDKFGGLCAYCEISVGKRGTVDHYVPQSMGGTNAFENLRWACLQCNQLKGDMPPEEWEMNKPPSRRTETRYEKRVRLLSGIAQRGSVDWAVVAMVALIVSFAGLLIHAIFFYAPIHCIEGYKFYIGVGDLHATQILDAEGRAISCESVRSSASKPCT